MNPYDIAKELINKYPNLHLVGSLARNVDHQNVHDIDFITDDTLPNYGKYYTFNYKGFKVDIWHYDNIEIGKFLRTYPKYLQIAIKKKLKEKGYKLTNNGVIDLDNNNRLMPFSVKSIFKLAEIKYRLP